MMRGEALECTVVTRKISGTRDRDKLREMMLGGLWYGGIPLVELIQNGTY